MNLHTPHTPPEVEPDGDEPRRRDPPVPPDFPRPTTPQVDPPYPGDPGRVPDQVPPIIA
jgi:hypothetical protein